MEELILSVQSTTNDTLGCRELSSVLRLAITPEFASASVNKGQYRPVAAVSMSLHWGDTGRISERRCI